jgi:imidazolonepropionase-like amidohydrolase
MRFFPIGILLMALLSGAMLSTAQTSFPVNGTADPRPGCYAFVNATLVRDPHTHLANATLIIRDGLIVAAGKGLTPPKDAVVIDCSGKTIYPSFIDIYSDYGMVIKEGRGGFDYRAPVQMNSNTPGAYDWNQAIHPETDASRLFTSDAARAATLRESGFGTVLTHLKDGIARGTGAVVTLADEKENLAIIKARASAHYSFSKGSSTQSYPSSLMGSIALLRQTYLDAEWYRGQPLHEGVNLSLQAWLDEQSLPQVFEANEKWNAIRANRIGQEFGVKYIIKAGNNEYQRISEIAATGSSYILSLNFPQAFDVEDPGDARSVSLEEMKNWEMAPSNPAAFEKAGITFCLTASDLKEPKDFLINLRKAIAYGLSEDRALEALTKTPASLLGIYDKVGSLESGKMANFLITTGPVFRDSSIIVENWVQGKRYELNQEVSKDSLGGYRLVNRPHRADSARRNDPNTGKLVFPFDGYGWDTLPDQQDLLIRNATVWTNEAEGRLENTDVYVKNGKISQIGKGLNVPGAVVIDGTGKHLTPGIIDEHSHIATVSINEGAHSVTSEVRIGDNLNPDDIQIYRQLAGGVTTAHILHGSANTIGGQTQLIKLRWGLDDEGLKFKNWDPFIKFALGENVKRTTSQNNNRFPDTRMGVEEVLMDAFTRAREYEAAWRAADSLGKKGGPVRLRRDLQLEALVEILEHRRFITCHSYVQSEVLSLMRVADKFGFRVNTFTHILEGYKVADQLKAHGANVSTFSDWWGYKMEVQDAIAYNAAIMQKMGLNVCINSDDPEQARRLNQEAAKTVKYGGVSEEEALKMVTLNPARALHVADRVGSIKVGKDADLVLWSDHPLSVYARAEQTIVDGIVYYSIERDAALRKRIAEERKRLVQKMIAEKKNGAPVRPATNSFTAALSCDEDGE